MKNILFVLAFFLWVSPAHAQFSAQLNWQDNSSGTAQEQGIIIERNLNGSPFVAILVGAQVDMVSYADSTLVQAAAVNIYCYRVKAYNSAGQSGYSNEACKTIAALPPPVAVPNAPTGLTVAAISYQTLETSWANDTPTASTELVRRPANQDAFTTVAMLTPGKSSYRQMKLPGKTTFCYKARAVVDGQVSDFSELSCATTK